MPIAPIIHTKGIISPTPKNRNLPPIGRPKLQSKLSWSWKSNTNSSQGILADPGAVSRVEGIFLGESLVLSHAKIPSTWLTAPGSPNTKLGQLIGNQTMSGLILSWFPGSLWTGSQVGYRAKTKIDTPIFLFALYPNCEHVHKLFPGNYGLLNSIK